MQNISNLKIIVTNITSSINCNNYYFTELLSWGGPGYFPNSGQINQIIEKIRIQYCDDDGAGIISG